MLDDELSAMKKISKLLDGLQGRARVRVIDYIRDKYDPTEVTLPTGQGYFAPLVHHASDEVNLGDRNGMEFPGA